MTRPPSFSITPLRRASLRSYKRSRRALDINAYSDPHHRLLGISRAISTNQSLELLFNQVVEALDASFPFDTCIFYTPTPLPHPLQVIQDLSIGTNLKKLNLQGLDSAPDFIHHAIDDGMPCLVRPEKPNGQPLVAGKGAAKLIYPVHTGSDIFGAFCLARQSLAFSPEEFDLAQLFLAQIGLALENALLTHETRVQATALQRLLPFSRALTRAHKVGEVTEAIGMGAMALSGADRVAVYGRGRDASITHLWSQGLSSSGLGLLLNNQTNPPAPSIVEDSQLTFTTDTWSLPIQSHWRALAELEGIRAMALCPVVYQDRRLADVDCFYDLPRIWSPGEREALEIYVRQAAIALENTRLHGDLEDAYLQTVLTLSRALDVRDAYTADHSRRLAIWAENTARRLLCSQEELQRIRWAALLHDIGKIGVPDAILHKAGPLSEDEWAIMKRHPELGVDILSPVRHLRPITPIIRAHQERFDGTGYPDGLSGEQIPLAARILTVVDAFGAMTDDRVFRKALSKREAVAELQRCAGKQFDRQIVEVFFAVLGAEQVIAH
ncbi:MAG: HD domain-containing protein [Anaerolineaceae bacterium]|nr:HD domain-containing protein [Anaerolineaceae bacterium]